MIYFEQLLYLVTINDIMLTGVKYLIVHFDSF